MMRRFIIFVLPAILSVCACSYDDLALDSPSKVMKVVACMPGNDSDDSKTRIGITENPKTLDITPAWWANDKIHTYVTLDIDRQWPEAKVISLGEQDIDNISSDGKKCQFNSGIEDDTWKKVVLDYNGQYQNKLLYGTCGRMSWRYDNGIYMIADMFRTTIENVKVPVWFEVKFTDDIPEAKCQYVGTFELLHISNQTDKKIVFKWDGYDAVEKWYYQYAGFDPHKNIVSETDTQNGTDTPLVDAIIAIPAGEERTLVAWYIPNGNKMKDVALAATIDGKSIKSVNKKSSDIDIQVGHAYHWYANWDGSNLYIDNFGENGLSFGEVVNEDI